MSLKLIVAAPLFLVVAATAGAAEQTRQATVVQDMATGPTAAGNKIKTPTGGTNLPAVQKVRDAANRSQQADKHKQHIEIESFSAGAAAAPAFAQRGGTGDDVIVDGRIITGENPASAGKAHAGFVGGIRVLGGDVDGAPASGGSRHTGGVNVLMGDGSVRNGVGSNETISIGSGSTETTKGGGLNDLKRDDTAGGAKATTFGGLGSLQGMGSINQLAAPPGTGDAAGGQVRNRTFSVVDRTQMSKDSANTGAVGGNKTQNIGIGRTETTAGGGPNVKAFSGSDSAGARGASGNITMKGQKIGQN